MLIKAILEIVLVDNSSQKVVYLLGDFILFLSNGWHTVRRVEGAGDKTYNFAVYFYFQITMVCNYIADIS